MDVGWLAGFFKVTAAKPPATSFRPPVVAAVP